MAHQVIGPSSGVARARIPICSSPISSTLLAQPPARLLSPPLILLTSLCGAHIGLTLLTLVTSFPAHIPLWHAHFLASLSLWDPALCLHTPCLLPARSLLAHFAGSSTCPHLETHKPNLIYIVLHHLDPPTLKGTLVFNTCRDSIIW